eukprot:7860952-Pyramimonas_sp.AAC.1
MSLSDFADKETIFSNCSAFATQARPRDQNGKGSAPHRSRKQSPQTLRRFHARPALEKMSNFAKPEGAARSSLRGA